MSRVLGVLGAVLGIVGVLAFCVGLGWFSLVTGRPMQKYAKETERQVYVNSVAHVQGANSGIGADCSNMENVSLPVADRHAYASMVKQDAAAYSGNQELSPEAQKCIGEADSLLSTQIP